VTDNLITTRAAAGLLGVGTTSIKRWSDDGTLACIRTAGGHRRFLRGDVLRLLQQGRILSDTDDVRPPADGHIQSRLPIMERAQLDALPFGVIQLDDNGRIVEYNAFEQRFAGRRRADVLGRRFFTDVAPCTNNRLLRGRFRDGVATGSMDLSTDYTFTYKVAPRVVRLHLFRDTETGTNWLLVHPR
jgi:photoactive yellow protein